jgi:hypothetical protein
MCNKQFDSIQNASCCVMFLRRIALSISDFEWVMSCETCSSGQICLVCGLWSLRGGGTIVNIGGGDMLDRNGCGDAQRNATGDD